MKTKSGDLVMCYIDWVYADNRCLQPIPIPRNAKALVPAIILGRQGGHTTARAYPVLTPFGKGFVKPEHLGRWNIPPV